MEAIKKIEIGKITKTALIAILGTALLTISAKTKIPFYPVPMTMQTFVVLFLGMALGYKIAVATVALYLFEGLIGIPVFATGGGLVYFTGPTTGYLIGFVFASATIWNIELKFLQSFSWIIGAFFSSITYYFLSSE